MSRMLNEEIVSVVKLAPSICKMTVRSEYIAQNAKPGQFVNVKCCEGLNALLRRPISICDADRERSTFDIVFQIKGTGTEYLSQKQPGSLLDLLGPLGRPFDLPEHDKRIAVVGGGIGIFPLLFLLKEHTGDSAAYLGFRSKEWVVLKEEFGKASKSLNISTDDGSFGQPGLVTESLEADLKKSAYDIIYTCGPMPMVRKVAETAMKNGVKCQVSLEQRMGCGIGACLVCACKTRKGDAWEYSHVCKDGPVFWAEEVVWE